MSTNKLSVHPTTSHVNLSHAKQLSTLSFSQRKSRLELCIHASYKFAAGTSPDTATSLYGGFQGQLDTTGVTDLAGLC